jgi:hypothetical protein
LIHQVVGQSAVRNIQYECNHAMLDRGKHAAHGASKTPAEKTDP